MGIFKSATEKLVTKEIEYKLHEKVLRDLANDKKDLGVWGKAFVDADGDDKKTEAVYVKLMVQHYKDTAKSEAELEAIWNENYQREQAQKAAAERERKLERLREEDRLEAIRLEEIRLEEEKKNQVGDGFYTGILIFSVIAFVIYSLFTS